MSTSKRVLSTAATVAAGLAIVGGAAMANAASSAPTPSPTGGYAAPTTGGGDTNTGPGSGSGTNSGSGEGSGEGRTRRAPHEHTAVTGDELTKVTAAVTAKDSAVTVTKVEKDPDGSYDVHGTKDGARVRFEVSADLASVTQGPAGPGGMGGGMGGHTGGQHTPVTGDEATRVGDAVKAKDSAVTVESVRKDPDGSYDVMGTKDGARVMYDVSADLATVTQAQGKGGGMGRGGHRHDQQGQGQQGQTQQSQQGQTQQG